MKTIKSLPVELIKGLGAPLFILAFALLMFITSPAKASDTETVEDVVKYLCSESGRTDCSK